MAAANSDLFRKGGANTVTTLAAPGKALAATSITVGSTTNYPTDTGIVIGIRQVDSDGILVPGTYSEYNATVTSGTTFSIDAVPVLGSDQVYPAGSTTQVFLPVSSSAHNDLIDGLVVSHNQDGTLKAGAVDNPAVLATDVVETAKIANSSVTPEKLQSGTGSSWAWQSWTPTWTNLTVGNGVATSGYTKIGKTVIFRYSLIFGTTTSITGSFPTFTLPSTAVTTTTNHQVGVNHYSYIDAGTNLYYGQNHILSGQTLSACTVMTASGTYTSEGGISSTVPFTWGNTDRIYISGTYQEA